MARMRFFFLLVFFSPLAASAQPDSLIAIKGIPTKQVFDLVSDSRGFIWIGHEMGLTRFDGITFTHFSNPEQNSLAVSNIMEDAQGRIWCRNFTSQVFYVENEKMNLLESYPYKKEPRFPQMLIIGNYLVCTSVRGVFTINTLTFKSRFISCKNIIITSISPWKNKIIAYGSPAFFLIDPKDSTGNVSRLQFNYTLDLAQGITLQGVKQNDTLYSYSPKTGNITKYQTDGKKIIISGTLYCRGMFNTMTQAGNDIWLHTSRESKTSDGKKLHEGDHNFTDIIPDKEGNTWFSSLSEGIQIKYRNYWKQLSLPFLQENEYIVKMDAKGDFCIFGTNQLRIVIQQGNAAKMRRQFLLPPEDRGPLQYIRFIDSNTVAVATSLRLYMVTLRPDRIRKLYSDYTFLSVKDVEKLDTSVYLAAATGFYKVVNKPDTLGNDFTCNQLSPMRSRCVVFDSVNGNVLIGFKDGLFSYDGQGFQPVLYNGKIAILATALYRYRDKIFIADFRGNIYVKDSSGLVKLTNPEDGRTLPVTTIQNFRDTIWILSPDYLRAIDPVTGKQYPGLYIPAFPGSMVFDIGYIGEKLVMLTNRGVYSMYTQTPGPGYLVKNHLLRVTVNGKDVPPEKPLKSANNQNSIEFYLAAPLYTSPEKLYYKFRLLKKGDTAWTHGESGVARFLFSSLKSGNYIFEAQAVHPQFGIAASPVRFPFTIQKSWSETALFRFGVSLLVALAILLPLFFYFRFRLKKQRMGFEKRLAVKQERERISAEIHDDIGASLSGLRLQTELFEQQARDLATKENLGKIHQSMKELSESMQEVIWSLNSRQDTLEDLLNFTQKQASRLFENSGILLETRLPEIIPPLSVSSDKRADIYLTVKEALHNALKHAKATTIKLDISIGDTMLRISVSDNGKGFDPQNKTITGNGLINMRKRISRLGGKLEIRGQKGTTVLVEVPLKG